MPGKSKVFGKFTGAGDAVYRSRPVAGLHSRGRSLMSTIALLLPVCCNASSLRCVCRHFSCSLSKRNLISLNFLQKCYLDYLVEYALHTLLR